AGVLARLQPRGLTSGLLEFSREEDEPRGPVPDAAHLAGREVDIDGVLPRVHEDVAEEDLHVMATRLEVEEPRAPWDAVRRAVDDDGGLEEVEQEGQEEEPGRYLEPGPTSLGRGRNWSRRLWRRIHR